MRKILIVIASVLLSGIAVYADERINVKLTTDQPQQIVSLKPWNCQIMFKIEGTDGDDKTRVSVNFENLDELNVILFFGKPFSKSQLKSQKPKVLFDKIFQGDKQAVEAYEKIKDLMIFDPKKTDKLNYIQVNNSVGVETFRIPFYIARFKPKTFWSFLGGSNGKNKLLLKQKLVYEFNVEVEVKPDEDFIRMEKECNDLIEEIKKQTFCTNPKHRPSLSNQEERYKQRIGKLKKSIEDIIKSNDWYNKHDSRYEKYSELVKKLLAVDFSQNERDCGRTHGAAATSGCKYCGLSPQQIFHKLGDYDKEIYSSNNRKAIKESVMPEVNLLYGCRKHSPSWKNSEYKSKINKLYDRINKY